MEHKSTRPFQLQEHLRFYFEEAWEPMFDADRRRLEGVEGKRGVRALTREEKWIGTDYIRIQPGYGFPMHTHDGDHEIYFMKGSGLVSIGGREISVWEGAIIHIPAELPHRVWVPAGVDEPLLFVAFGHPHIQVTSALRSRSVPHSTSPAPAHRET